MYYIHQHCMLTCDPKFLDFHSDSTDFEDSQPPHYLSKNEHYSLPHKHRKRIKVKNVPNPKLVYTLSKRRSKEIWKRSNVKIETRNVNKKTKVPDSYDQINTEKSSTSLKLPKTVPYKSNKSNLKNKDDDNKQNDRKKACNKHESQSNSLNRRKLETAELQPSQTNNADHKQSLNQAYLEQAISSLYPLVKDNKHENKFMNRYYNLITSSLLQRQKKKEKLILKKWEREIKNYLDSAEKLNQCPHSQKSSSHSKTKSLHVYTNTCQLCESEIPTSVCTSEDCSSTGVKSSACFKFLDYLFNKIYMKQARDKEELKENVCKRCYCDQESQSRKQQKASGIMDSISSTCISAICSMYPYTSNTGILDDGVPKIVENIASRAKYCSAKECTAKTTHCTRQYSPDSINSSQDNCSESVCSLILCTPSPMNVETCNTVPESQAPPTKDSSIEVETEITKPSKDNRTNCIKSTNSIKNPSGSAISNKLSYILCSAKNELSNRKENQQSHVLPKIDEQTQITQSCQMSHDSMIQSINKKYDGEILCIHNPPCILINGCLNFTDTRQKSTLPIIEIKRANIQHMFKREKSKTLIEQSCQYQELTELNGIKSTPVTPKQTSKDNSSIEVEENKTSMLNNIKCIMKEPPSHECNCRQSSHRKQNSSRLKNSNPYLPRCDNCVSTESSNSDDYSRENLNFYNLTVLKGQEAETEVLQQSYEHCDQSQESLSPEHSTSSDPNASKASDANISCGSMPSKDLPSSGLKTKRWCFYVPSTHQLPKKMVNLFTIGEHMTE